MSERKNSYAAPALIRSELGNGYLSWMTRNLESGAQELESDYVTVVDRDRKFVEVSDNFCLLVGYEREELLGRRYDDLTAPNTVDIQKVFDLFTRLGNMHGLWMLVSRGGTRILVRYESRLRPNSLIEGHMELVGAGY
jgi:PAS domain S-box-containing protein